MPPIVRPTTKPFWTTTDGETVKLYHGHVVNVLRSLREKSVQCVVTSPPYWGLRDYGEGQEVKWEDGWFGAYGAEPTPDMFVLHTVFIFREVRRVLRDDGTLWLNFGDSYNGSGGSGGAGKQDTNRAGKPDNRGGSPTLAQGNLVGIPWRVALALQADGWVLRQDIIWHKPAPMPESVQNRCTKSHEYVFLLTKSMRYFYDAEAIKESQAESSLPRAAYGFDAAKERANAGRIGGTDTFAASQLVPADGRRNKRSVWTVSSQGYEGAHFATFPTKLIEPMILAGTSAHCACSDCGSPWRRIVEKEALVRERPNDYVKRTGEEGTGNICANTVAGVETRTTGWEPTCECHGRFEKTTKIVSGKVIASPDGGRKYTNLDSTEVSPQGGYSKIDREVSIERYVSDLPLDEHPVQPCVVLDPFVGSGTTVCIAVSNGRRGIGIDLSEKYLLNNAIPRVEGTLLNRPSLSGLVKRNVVKLTGGRKITKPSSG